jgi:hypothetical protein
MKTILTILILTLAFLDAAIAVEPTQTFAEAGKDYDAGNYADAEKKYESILGQGLVSHELFFNLGNAFYKQGRTGEAVLNYRRAWMLSPRDPDAAANLRLAAQNTSALLPNPPLVTLLLLKVSVREWIGVALTAYWLCAILIAGHFFLPARRLALRRLIAIAAVALACGLAGTMQWISLHRRPEMVVLETGQQALFAPMANSTPHFALPPGSVVRMIETSGPWVKVTYGSDSGWIRAEACAPVCPWTANG